MKATNKILTSLALCVFIGLLTTSCTEKVKYDPAEQLTNAQIYFSTDLPSKINLPVDMNVKSFDIEVLRIIKTNDLTVNLTVENDNPELYNVPSTVTFTANSDVAKLTVTYDPTKLTFDEFTSIKITVSDESLTSPYGNFVYEFTVGMPAPWESLGDATFSDTWLFDNSYSVEIERNMIDPTRYRLVDPYSEGLDEEGYIPDDASGNQCAYLEFQVLPAGSVYKGVTTTVNGLVVYDDFDTGWFESDYGADVVCMHPSRFTKYATENFWLHNIVTQFSADGEPEVVQLAPMYYMAGIGGWDQTQNDGLITIVFPGVVLADYSSDVEYNGRYTDTNGDLFAVANVTLGADVEYAKVALVPGSLTGDDLDGIIDGSIESVQIDASGTVQLPCSTAGRYTFVVVTYAEDEAKDYSSVSFNFTTGDAATLYPAEDFYGDYIMTGLSVFDDSEMDPMSVTIAAGDDPNTAVITGIDYAANVMATFPVKGYMSIMPQALANYGPYDMTWLSVTPDWDINDEDALIFTRLESGDIVLTPDSYAMGYILDSDKLGGYADGYYNIAFTPASSSKAATFKAASKVGATTSTALKAKSSGSKNGKSLGKKVITKKKGSVKKALRDRNEKSSAAPI